MNTPPFLLAAAALLWGAQTGHWMIAAACAALLEAPRYFAPRWHLAAAEFNRVSDFCTVLLFVLAAYLYVTFGNPRAITLLFQWLPLILLPLVLAQAWSTAAEIDLSVLFGSLRRKPLRRPLRLNLAYPAFSVWLLAASAANQRGMAFYIGLTLLVAWPLLQLRPRSHATPLAALMLVAAALAGFGAQHGLHRLQLWLEAEAPEWLAASGTRVNPYRSRTDIGSIGELKLSQRIVLRVQADSALPAPLLLHRASFDDYAGATWIARAGKFESMAPAESAGFGKAASWKLADAPAAAPQVTVYDDSDGNPVLSLPANTAKIENLAAVDLKSNPLGAVQIENKPGFFSYRARVGGGNAAYSAPTPRDTSVPRSEADAIRRIAAELQLAALPPAQALDAVKRYFVAHFEYATWQAKPAGTRTPLAEFLLVTRAGHCEYFASAATLLLREAGIPARYATGYSAQERSTLDDTYIVRESHAHAWVRAWIDGAWRDLDATPPTWVVEEAERAPFWSPLADLWSWARFRVSAWSARTGESGWSDALLWLALPLIAWLAWRTLRGKRAASATGAGGAGAKRAWPGQDSEFHQIEGRMAELGRARRATETAAEWLARLRDEPAPDIEELRGLAHLHYRHRFDPAGLPDAERAALRERALAWLARHPSPAA